MQFCPISPSSTLSRYSTSSNVHLVLPQVKDDVYRKFYRDRRDQGDLIILDNGEYEGEQDLQAFGEAMAWYHPQIAVLPDHLLHPWKETWDAAQKFLDLWYHHWMGVRWMYVPQSTIGDVVGFIEGLVEGLRDSRITAIGIPRALPTKITTDSYIRANVCEYVKKHSPGTYVHALGLANGSLVEMRALRHAGCDSIDSGAPVWRGIQGYSLAGGCYLNKPEVTLWDDIPVDFNWAGEITPEMDKLIKSNLEVVYNKCK